MLTRSVTQYANKQQLSPQEMTLSRSSASGASGSQHLREFSQVSIILVFFHFLFPLFKHTLGICHSLPWYKKRFIIIGYIHGSRHGTERMCVCMRMMYACCMHKERAQDSIVQDGVGDCVCAAAAVKSALGIRLNVLYYLLGNVSKTQRRRCPLDSTPPRHRRISDAPSSGCQTLPPECVTAPRVQQSTMMIRSPG